MESLYLCIADFIIKLGFKQVKTTIEPLRESFIQQISGFFKDFVILTPPSSVDFFIDFTFNDNGEMHFHMKEKKVFMELLTFTSDKRITTSYRLNMTQMQLVIREALQILLSKNSGFILHASAIEINNQAYLFTGNSGAGKSTTMLMLRETFRPLADDTIILRKRRNKYVAYEMPFVEKNEIKGKTSKSVEIGKIFFLKKADFFRATPIIDKSKVIQNLSKQLFTSRGDLQLQVKYLLEFVSLTDSFYNLYFAKQKEDMTSFIRSME